MDAAQTNSKTKYRQREEKNLYVITKKAYNEKNEKK